MVCVPKISTIIELGDEPSNSSRLEVVAEHQGHLTLHQVGVTLAQHRQYVRSRCSRDTLGQSPLIPGSFLIATSNLSVQSGRWRQVR